MMIEKPRRFIYNSCREGCSSSAEEDTPSRDSPTPSSKPSKKNRPDAGSLRRDIFNSEVNVRRLEVELLKLQK